MEKKLKNEIGIIQAKALYNWADNAVENGNFRATPFIDLKCDEELTLGAIVSIHELEISEAVKMGISVITDSFPSSREDKEAFNAKS